MTALVSRWVCPHCQHASIIAGSGSSSGRVNGTVKATDGDWGVTAQFIACPNPSCGLTTIHISYGTVSTTGPGAGGWANRSAVKTIRLRPPSYARPIPEYVPQAIRDDYLEACSILDLSPKAAATLARRALQGMIRDFHGVRKATLALEVEGIKEKVDPLIWQAIEAVRKVGNIGAHMEKDINVIVDVEPDEAARLVRLIEMLVKEWYVGRRVREEELSAIVAMNERKQEDRRAVAGGADASTESRDGSG